MASRPGLLTDWPWKSLGSFKYVVLAPWVAHSLYSYAVKDKNERDFSNLLIFPFLLSRMVHNQIWISLSRYRTAKGSNRIVDKPIEFDQIDRETDWDDQIIFNGFLFYLGSMYLRGASHLPIWRTEGIIITTLLHIGPVEFLYYWLHRALHHHYLYSRYHSHHHSSIVTEPITSVIHPFAEHIAYFALFSIPLVTVALTKTGSITSFAGYIIYLDFMNNLGHCNFELVPKWLFSIFPPLKYLMYTPSYHSLHHTQFRTNYSLFMPLYDYIYNTTDKSSNVLYETSLSRKEKSPDVVHLTHLTTPESIYHMRLGFAGVASKPLSSKWYIWLMWPVTLWTVMMTWIYGSTFVVERNVFKNLKTQTWAVPKYTIQFLLNWQKLAINGLIEKAILEAEERGVKVLSLGLMNQGDKLNKNGEIYIRRYPQLKVKVVDGSSLVVAVVLNSIPKETTQVLLRGNFSKVACSIALSLCQRGIKVSTIYEDEYTKLKLALPSEAADNLAITKCNAVKKYLLEEISDHIACSNMSQRYASFPIPNHYKIIWLVGDGLAEKEQLKAGKGTSFIPFSQFPPKKLQRNDCLYYNTPSLIAPKHLENVDSCENWLPRRVMSAWRVAGIIHGLEKWNVNECGNFMFDIDKVWEATLRHGFVPFNMTKDHQFKPHN